MTYFLIYILVGLALSIPCEKVLRAQYGQWGLLLLLITTVSWGVMVPWALYRVLTGKVPLR